MVSLGWGRRNIGISFSRKSGGISLRDRSTSLVVWLSLRRRRRWMLGLGAHGDGGPVIRQGRRSNVGRVKFGIGRIVDGAMIGDWICMIGRRLFGREGIGWISTCTFSTDPLLLRSSPTAPSSISAHFRLLKPPKTSSKLPRRYDHISFPTRPPEIFPSVLRFRLLSSSSSSPATTTLSSTFHFRSGVCGRLRLKSARRRHHLLQI